MASTLRAHVWELHPQLKKLPRDNGNLARLHSRTHWRMHCSHTHAEDNAGVLAGPNTDQRRPSGWQTGLGVIMRQSRG